MLLYGRGPSQLLLWRRGLHEAGATDGLVRQAMRRLLELVGKATWQKPAIAVFRSARNDLYFPARLNPRTTRTSASGISRPPIMRTSM